MLARGRPIGINGLEAGFFIGVEDLGTDTVKDIQPIRKLTAVELNAKAGQALSVGRPDWPAVKVLIALDRAGRETGLLEHFAGSHFLATGPVRPNGIQVAGAINIGDPIDRWCRARTRRVRQEKNNRKEKGKEKHGSVQS